MALRIEVVVKQYSVPRAMSIAGPLKAALKPLVPLLPSLPTPVLTLFPSMLLHYGSHPAPSLRGALTSPTSHPLHGAILFTLVTILIYWILSVVSGNVSWVDRAWPFVTPICSTLIYAWALLSPEGEVYRHNLPRMTIMLLLQYAWSARLTRNAIRRNYYDLKHEDYRYALLRKIVPGWVFALVHPFVVSIAQPLLLLAVALPLHAVLILPPSELSAGPVPSLALPLRLVDRLLPGRSSASPSTPVLNILDLVLIVFVALVLVVEHKADDAMYAYQTAKHSSKSKDPIQPAPAAVAQAKRNPKLPGPTPYPREFYPGFPTKGLWRWSRHPNFAAEQTFWLTQALFAVVAGESSGVTRRGWVGDSVFAGAFAYSLLFCGSTTLTEWISGRKYPEYKAYKRLVGQFLPQETALLWLWGTLTRSRAADLKEVYNVPNAASARTSERSPLLQTS